VLYWSYRHLSSWSQRRYCHVLPESCSCIWAVGKCLVCIMKFLAYRYFCLHCLPNSCHMLYSVSFNEITVVRSLLSNAVSSSYSAVWHGLHTVVFVNVVYVCVRMRGERHTFFHDFDVKTANICHSILDILCKQALCRLVSVCRTWEQDSHKICYGLSSFHNEFVQSSKRDLMNCDVVSRNHNLDTRSLSCKQPHYVAQ